MPGSSVFLMSLWMAYSASLPAASESELSPDIHTRELRAHVYRLASPEFLGRRGPGAARTSRHLAEAFKRLELKPAFGESYYQSIPSLLTEGTSKASVIGRNVGAILPGSDPKLKDEWILLSAHFDHLGKRGEVLYPGADDNATGVAMLLEVAEYFALSKEKPRRTIAFISFDQEEAGLRGSMYFAAHPPLSFRNLKAFLTADMLGRSMANVMDEYVFLMGSERSTHLRRLVEKTAVPRGLKIGRLGADLVGTRSDYGPFRDRKIPFLFFSTGQHPDYHSPSDVPERIDYQKLQRICVYIRDVVKRLANDDAVPSWNEKPLPPDLDEIRTVAVLVNRVLKRPDLYPLPEKKRDMVRSVQQRLSKILENGKVAVEDRSWLMWNARLLLITVF
ncbi:MAG TPA: M20/M25/M40 family metallo-hydrolase [Gemmataceae bacterium]|nr:M20/M25/M40 family metallo-hydrolase [Gemmataceae bacterium]